MSADTANTKLWKFFVHFSKCKQWADIVQRNSKAGYLIYYGQDQVDALLVVAYCGIKDFAIQAIESGLFSVNSQFQALEVSVNGIRGFIDHSGAFTDWPPRKLKISLDC